MTTLLDLVMPVYGRSEWRADASCLDVDPEAFFVVPQSGLAHDIAVARAKAICAKCPVRERCVREALNTGAEGIWGGLTDAERRTLRRTLRRRGERR